MSEQPVGLSSVASPIGFETHVERHAAGETIRVLRACLIETDDGAG
jgi:hypothetical protein